jgi:hypothetical protein
MLPIPLAKLTVGFATFRYRLPVGRACNSIGFNLPRFVVFVMAEFTVGELSTLGSADVWWV